MTGSRHASFRRVHEPKKDAWLVAVLYVAAILCLFGCYSVLRDQVTETVKVIVGGLCVLSAVLCLWPLYTTRYIIGRTNLTVRCGPFRWKISLRKIRSVDSACNALSSAALSFDRLHIKYGGSWSGIYISPLDKDGFLRDLVAVCPHLRYDGGRVVYIG